MLLDTCAIIFDALAPEKLGKKAKEEIAKGRLSGTLACSDISLWEIAMLIGKGRLKPDAQTNDFLQLVVAANRLTVLPISPGIASLSANDELFQHNDPADRLIASTAIHHKMSILTSDRELKKVKGLKTIW